MRTKGNVDTFFGAREVLWESMGVVLLCFACHDKDVAMFKCNVDFVSFLVNCLELEVACGSEGDADDDGVGAKFGFIVGVMIDLLGSVLVAIDEVAADGSVNAEELRDG